MADENSTADGYVERIDREMRQLDRNQQELEYATTYQKYKRANDNFSMSYTAEFFGPALLSTCFVMLEFISTKVMQIGSKFSGKDVTARLEQIKDISSELEKFREKLKEAKSQKAPPESIEKIKAQTGEMVMKMRKIRRELPIILKMASAYKDFHGNVVERIGIIGFLEIVLLFTAALNGYLFAVQHHLKKKLDAQHVALYKGKVPNGQNNQNNQQA